MDSDYPSPFRRYLASFIDLLFVIIAFFLVSNLFQGESNAVAGVRVVISLGLFLVYEPICTSRFCTVGQRLMGVRVRSYPSLNRISVPAAYIRILAKGFLGIISFFSMPFNEKRRAIHDYAVRSIVVFSREAVGRGLTPMRYGLANSPGWPAGYAIGWKGDEEETLVEAGA